MEQPDVGEFVYDELHIAATLADGVTRCAVYRLDEPVVVLGRGSRVERELWWDACLADGVAVQRRRGGGCAVVLTPGDVLVSVTAEVPGYGGNPAHFQILCRWLAQGLAAVGHAHVVQDGISDLVLQDRKVGGSCLYRTRGLLYFSATLAVQPRTDLMTRYLRHPPREPAYRAARPHADFVGVLDPRPGAPARVEAALRAVLQLPTLGAASEP